MAKAKKSSDRSGKKLRITRRLVTTKRHTQGYVVDGQDRTVPQVMKMVERNQVSGVRVVGNHIQSMSGRKNLLDLPVTLVK